MILIITITIAQVELSLAIIYVALDIQTIAAIFIGHSPAAIVAVWIGNYTINLFNKCNIIKSSQHRLLQRGHLVPDVRNGGHTKTVGYIKRAYRLTAGYCKHNVLKEALRYVNFGIAGIVFNIALHIRSEDGIPHGV